MLTHEANAIAIKGRAKAVREALRTLGMRRCSVRLVYRQAEDSTDRLNWYALFWRWFGALWRANREGAEFLFEDFRSRVLALRAETELQDADWNEQLETCEGEHSDIIRAAFRNRDDVERLKVEIAQDIAAKRRLLGMIEARQQREQQRTRRVRAA